MTNKTAFFRLTGPGVAWPPLLKEQLPNRLEQIGGRPGTYQLAAGSAKPICNLCGARVRADLHDGSTECEAKPEPGITIRARLCRECANAAGIPDSVVMLP